MDIEDCDTKLGHFLLTARQSNFQVEVLVYNCRVEAAAYIRQDKTWGAVKYCSEALGVQAAETSNDGVMVAATMVMLRA